MKTRIQIALAVLLVGGAAAATTLYTRGDAAPSEQEGGGHANHGVVTGGDELNPVTLTDEAARLIGITFADAEVRSLARTVSAVGRIVYDETRLATVNPKIEGWVERLYVDFTGKPVEKGEPLLDLYSPLLVSAQEELILARRLVDETTGDPDGRAAINAQTLLESARRRLEYWDIPADAIARIEETGEMSKTLTLRAPASGIVVEKGVVEGDRMTPGMTVFRIADLSTVWVEVDVFEKDLSLVHLGQTGLIGLEAYPGESFHGTVTYVYPTVSMEARTGRIRLELANPGLRLMPGMYASIKLTAPTRPAVLLIPRSAVLSTGERALVFVPMEDGTLMPREIVTGLAAGRDIEVLAGLEPGERVVSSAGFLVDAESNLGTSIVEMDMEAASESESEMDMDSDPAPADHSAHDSAAGDSAQTDPGTHDQHQN